ncbi:hypothetical protein WA158_008247 [Blastocystis sp. Blastoise]
MEFELCSKCLICKDKNSFTKSQWKSKDLKICKDCIQKMKSIVDADEDEEKNEPVTIDTTIYKPLSKLEEDKKDQMKCLTMHQPWASLLVYGIKRVEGRGWYSNFKGRLWIHAASKEVTEEEIKQVEDYYRDLYAEENPNITITFPKKYPTSALLGCIDVIKMVDNREYQTVRSKANLMDEEGGSPYVFLCQNYHRLMLPFKLSGQHKIWRLNSKDCKNAQKTLKEQPSPIPVDFYKLYNEK